MIPKWSQKGIKCREEMRQKIDAKTMRKVGDEKLWKKDGKLSQNGTKTEPKCHQKTEKRPGTCQGRAGDPLRQLFGLEDITD